ncbi:prepilin-type N-terminal cleavage/methylation domain-containing protein [Clostridium chauvoei]|nr:prepilin-type N-terminal cleavage/methylation domain-containing protein [Clostridium chauvoei]MBX7400476.1 prepilin-type N-terminal cleavage/methylation domain-containing protein [Clostridium chauvoei]
MSKKTGFTIIELIVVIFIITIVITGGFSMIASFQKIREK